MSGYVGVIVSDPWLQSQFTQVELRGFKSKVSILNPAPIFSLAKMSLLSNESWIWDRIVPFSKEGFGACHSCKFAACFGKVEGSPWRFYGGRYI